METFGRSWGLRVIGIIFSLYLAMGGKASPQESYTLTGTVLTPTETIANGSVTVRGEKISDVRSASSNIEAVKVIPTGGIILPGLLDLHDHLSWNALPRWKPNSEFANRYEWQAQTAYLTTLFIPHQELVDEGLLCDLGRYAEIKAIVGGATSVVGTTGDPCLMGLARNLDWYSGLYKKGELNHEKLAYQVFPFEFPEQDPNKYPFADAERVRAALANKSLTAFLIHVAEGKPTDAASAREFRMLKGRGFLQRGVVVIHGVALSEADFNDMKKNGVGLVWSPRSNVELYGATANVAAAKRLGVKMALAPDWSPTGSSGMLDELRYAGIWNYKANPKDEVFSDSDLVKMATSAAAELAGLETSLGTIAPGFYADLLVIRSPGMSHPASPPPEASTVLVHTRPEDVQLVVIGGIPTYGDPALMARLLPGRALEKLTICGVEKALYFGTDVAVGLTPRSWHDTEATLAAALSKRGLSLAPLAECN
jgi:5-methylthioadenosine/S-adenosylhomocysteine deaminase